MQMLTAMLCFTTSAYAQKAPEVASDEASMLPRTSRVLTQAEQRALSPQQVLDLIKAGNARFVNANLTKRNHSKQIRSATAGQFPKAVVLSCLDSRIPVEDVFDCGIGDLFVARVAGNISNIDIVGSMEFACKASGSKLALVLGHDDCGAVKGAIARVELGNLTAVLKNIHPAVDSVAGFQGKRTEDNPEFVRKVTEQNVRLTVQGIRDKSPILRGMEAAGDILIVGAIYDMQTGQVSFLD